MATLEEIKKKQEELNEMIKIFEREQEKEEENLSTVWVPQYHEAYFFINSYGTVLCSRWDGCRYDKSALKTNNAFKTQEEAENHVEWLKILYELRTLGGDYWHNIKKENEAIYTLLCDHEFKTIHINSVYTIQDAPLPIYFKTQEQLGHAIETIGEDRLKKYWFRVED